MIGFHPQWYEEEGEHLPFVRLTPRLVETFKTSPLLWYALGWTDAGESPSLWQGPPVRGCACRMGNPARPENLAGLRLARVRVVLKNNLRSAIDHRNSGAARRAQATVRQ